MWEGFFLCVNPRLAHQVLFNDPELVNVYTLVFCKN